MAVGVGEGATVGVGVALDIGVGVGVGDAPRENAAAFPNGTIKRIATMTNVLSPPIRCLRALMRKSDKSRR